MSYFQEIYIKPKYRPKSDELICTYKITSKLDFKEAATIVATESSIGTWTSISTLKKSTIKKLAPKVFYLNSKTKTAKIAYNLDLFEKSNIPQLMSSIAGNIFSVKEIEKLRLENIEFPKKYLKGFLGPAYGINGVRKYFKNKKDFLLGSIIKPKLGLTYKEHAALAYEVWRNGIDVVKDDENLTNQTFNQFKKRVLLVLKYQAMAEKETKKRKIHAFNITSNPDQMLERAKFVKANGGKCIMIDIVSCGYSSIDYIRRQKINMIIHGHRAGHSAFTRDPDHGISMLVVAKLSRLVGVDQIHTGTVIGKMDGEKKDILEINKAMSQPMYNIKPSLTIASGGLYPGLVDRLIKILGKDTIVNFGGGIHGHPDGSAAGARAAYQAREAVKTGKSTKQYAKDHEELAKAIKKWGI